MWMDKPGRANDPHKGDAMKSKLRSSSATGSDEQLAGFIAKFDSPMARLIRSVRATLRKRMAAANELVYDNYNFFVIGYCSTERPSDCIVSLVANATGIALSFYYGSTLPDPARILQGSGNQNRFVRLAKAEDLARPEIEALIAAAIRQGKTPLAEQGSGHLIIRAIAAKQRPRRVAAKLVRAE
jgi:hypothetical protein